MKVKCTNCRKPITGKSYDHSAVVNIMGTAGTRARISRVLNCEKCENQINADLKLARERTERELVELRKSLGI